MHATQSDTVQLKALGARNLLKCPGCQTWPGRIQIIEGDTIEYCHQKIDREKFDAALFWGLCPLCRVNIYTLEVSIVSDPHMTYRFINDHLFESKRSTLYQSSSASGIWELTHHEDVSKMMFIPSNGDVLEGSDTLVEHMAWIDVYEIPGFTAMSVNEAFARAITTLDQLLPELCSLRWQ